MVPTVTAPIAAVDIADSPALVRDYRLAQSFSDRPVKITLPGPMTIIDSIADNHYHDEAVLGADLAAALNSHITALSDAGCVHIQIDEPVMARKPDIALDFGLGHLADCFDGLPDSIARTVHACCGYPNQLDQLLVAQLSPSARSRHD